MGEILEKKGRHGLRTRGESKESVKIQGVFESHDRFDRSQQHKRVKEGEGGKPRNWGYFQGKKL